MILLHCRGKQRAAPHPWADMILLIGSTSIFQSILYSWLSVWGQKKNGLHTGTVQILFTLTRIKSKGKALKREEGKSGEEKLLRRWYKAHGSQATGAKEQGKIWYVVNRDCAAFFVLQLVNSTIQDYSWTVHPSFAPTWHFHCCSAISEGWSKLCCSQTATGFLYPGCASSWLAGRSKDTRAQGCPTPCAPPHHRNSSSRHCPSPPSVLFPQNLLPNIRVQFMVSQPTPRTSFAKHTKNIYPKKVLFSTLFCHVFVPEDKIWCRLKVGTPLLGVKKQPYTLGHAVPASSIFLTFTF